MDAARLLHTGQLDANPITLALIGKTDFVLASCTTERIVLYKLGNYRQYAGHLPKDLAEYLAHFRRGEPGPGDKTFELTLYENG